MFVMVCLLPMLAFSQNFSVVSNAVYNGQNNSGDHCFQLTAPTYYQKGAIWNNTPVNLSQDFTVNARLYFGSMDVGADGIAFVLQNEGTTYIGNEGAGIGYHRFNGPPPMPTDVPGPVPSFIVEFDTWQNDFIYLQNIGDPAADHVGFMSNSNAYHTAPTALKAPENLGDNIEDGQWHNVQFRWNAAARTMTVEFVTRNAPLLTQTFSYTGDIVNTIFNGNPNVYWGFTGATGSFSPNEHAVCIVNDVPPPPVTCGGLRTQTPGGWGAPPRGNNPGAYLHSRFNTAFPSGLTIGASPNYHALFTSAQAITNFMPSGGQPKKLTQNYTNPTSNLKNTLAGHIVALTLSVRFDDTDPGFASGGMTLGDMLIGSGAFNGWRVRDFLAEANRVLGGTSNAYSVGAVLETATNINENNVDGNGDNGFLECPPNASGRRMTTHTVAATVQPFRMSPNPSAGLLNLQLARGSGATEVIITNGQGAIVERRGLSAAAEGQNLRFDLGRYPSGLYLVRVVTPAGEQTQKLVIQR